MFNHSFDPSAINPWFNSTVLDIPRPHIDPISSFEEALAVVSLAARHPTIDETIALHLDAESRGVALVRLDPSRTSLAHDVVASCSMTPTATQTFVVTFRIGSPLHTGDPAQLGRLASVLGSAGFALRDWVVVGRGGFYCPRVLTENDDPWRRPQPGGS